MKSRDGLPNSALDLAGLAAIQVRLGYTPVVATPIRTAFGLPARQVSASVVRPVDRTHS